MTRDELHEILENHALWLHDKGGRRAVLYDAVLYDAVLRGADLRWADLCGAVLSGADLSGADLSGAVLRGADLRWADLRWAVLSGADLSGADLRGADLSGAVGPYTVFSCSRWVGVAAGGYLCIGCQRFSYQYWRDHGNDVASANGVTGDDLSDWSAMILAAINRQERIEAMQS